MREASLSVERISRLVRLIWRFAQTPGQIACAVDEPFEDQRVGREAIIKDVFVKWPIEQNGIYCRQFRIFWVAASSMTRVLFELLYGGFDGRNKVFAYLGAALFYVPSHPEMNVCIEPGGVINAQTHFRRLARSRWRSLSK